MFSHLNTLSIKQEMFGSFLTTNNVIQRVFGQLA